MPDARPSDAPRFALFGAAITALTIAVILIGADGAILWLLRAYYVTMGAIGIATTLIPNAKFTTSAPDPPTLLWRIVYIASGLLSIAFMVWAGWYVVASLAAIGIVCAKIRGYQVRKALREAETPLPAKSRLPFVAKLIDGPHDNGFTGLADPPPLWLRVEGARYQRAYTAPNPVPNVSGAQEWDYVWSPEHA